jgi:hypothetical protein
MPTKILDLDTVQLNYWAAIAEGYGPTIATYLDFITWASLNQWDPAHNWEDIGPILHREQIGCVPQFDDRWFAYSLTHAQGAYGPTPQLAGVRAYLISCYGQTVPTLKELACPT